MVNFNLPHLFDLFTPVSVIFNYQNLQTDENKNIIVSKYHNSSVNDTPNLTNYTYDGDISDNAMKKAFQKIYQ